MPFPRIKKELNLRQTTLFHPKLRSIMLSNRDSVRQILARGKESIFINLIHSGMYCHLNRHQFRSLCLTKFAREWVELWTLNWSITRLVPAQNWIPFVSFIFVYIQLQTPAPWNGFCEFIYLHCRF